MRDCVNFECVAVKTLLSFVATLRQESHHFCRGFSGADEIRSLRAAFHEKPTTRPPDLSMADTHKRKATDAAGGADKRAKSKKQWRVPKKGESGFQQAKNTIQPGDSGIWVSCDKGRENKCIHEVKDLFGEYAERLYPHAHDTANEDETAEGGDVAAEKKDSDLAASIEDEINAEVRDIRKPSTPELFTPIMLNVPCVVFFRTRHPVDPVSFVKTICEDALKDSSHKRTRFAKRLSPMTLVGRASTEGLEKVAAEVLKPHFHQEPFKKRKFAIRPTIRNHTVLTRDAVIKQVASVVGPGHQVDLNNYELLIVVEVYQNVCGVSVLDDSFERLKRYNLSEIFEPTPKGQDVKK
ncbi:hypothetical protein AC579_6607 [Pseudocercospora musae]|uniref:THUMP domain-containing protein n=1 Tax=Pseudocercospora musae TaxID=113226 RepID=A0A139I688_9PEZI|nr:hypothetical protein AC579_6607 [Pseudocercospora musae]KXT10274.1 hypothetical protein AC579_6607 [Pseudocercospora musae]KXT10275.1 hypothetical protein AC579_6607 [Pseudocercospora musae]